MSDAEPVDPAPLRRKLARIARKTEKNRTRLLRMMGDNPATLNEELLANYLTELETASEEYEELSTQVSEYESNPTAADQDTADADKWGESMEAATKTCMVLKSMKQVHSLTRGLDLAVTILNEAYDDSPEASHEDALAGVKTLAAQLRAAMLASPVDTEHAVVQNAGAVIKAVDKVKFKSAVQKQPLTLNL